MPIITVQGIPIETPQNKLQLFRMRLAEATNAHITLEKKIKDISFFFPHDLFRGNLSEEIIITVDGLFIKPQRDAEVRKGLATSLAKYGKEIFPKAKVECFIHPFDPSDGFCVIE